MLRYKIVSSNPLETILNPKQDKTITDYLTVDEMFALLDSIKTKTSKDKRDKAIFETFYSTGIRISELAFLNIEDIDKNDRLISVLGKGNKKRIVPIGKKAIKAIANYIETLDKKNKRSYFFK